MNIDDTSVNRYNDIENAEGIAMKINEILTHKKMTKYRLSKESGVAQTTITDICSGKTRMEKCEAGTLYRIAKTLNVSMESLLNEEIETKEKMEHRTSFDVFRSNVCHAVKDKGQINFLIDQLENDEIHQLYERRWYPEALYLLAMVDYLSRINNIPLCTRYDNLRSCKLETIIYPTSLQLLAAVLQNDQLLQESREQAIPEFMRHNIVESEVENVI